MFGIFSLKAWSRERLDNSKTRRAVVGRITNHVEIDNAGEKSRSRGALGFSTPGSLRIEKGGFHGDLPSLATEWQRTLFPFRSSNHIRNTWAEASRCSPKCKPILIQVAARTRAGPIGRAIT
jgi:hypothetical protein